MDRKKVCFKRHTGRVVPELKMARSNLWGGGRQLSAALFLFLSFFGFAQSDLNPVAISRVDPSRGSLAGGTRMHIKGRGFSQNLNKDGNIVIIGGKYRCDVIPLHSTVNQIACKTRSALGDAFLVNSGRSTYEAGQTADLDVVVIVDGQYTSVCQSPDPALCRFRYPHEYTHHTYTYMYTYTYTYT
jgi:hypothetical protein